MAPSETPPSAPGAWWARTVDGSTLALFRAALCLLVLQQSVMNYMSGEWTAFFSWAAFNFPHESFTFLPTLEPAWMDLVLAGILLCSTLCVIGVATRPCSGLLALLFAYQFFVEASRYTGHHYLFTLSLVLLPLLDTDRWMSLLPGRVATPDGAGGRTSRGSDSDDDDDLKTHVPYWHLWWLQAQVSLVYFYAGVAKVSGDWLWLNEPVKSALAERADEIATGGGGGTVVSAVVEAMREPWVPAFLCWAGMVFDLAIGFLLMSPHGGWRAFGLVNSTLFHCTNAVLFPGIGTFPYQMLAANILFLPADLPRNLWALVRGTEQDKRRYKRSMERRRRASLLTLEPRSYRRGSRTRLLGMWLDWRVCAVVMGLWLAVQACMPMRHVMYTNDVVWSAEGTFMSWRMMMTQKSSFVRFRVVDPSSSGVTFVDPQSHSPLPLVPRQVTMMGEHAFMMVRYARAEATRWWREKKQVVRVHADSFVSLHGRPFQRFIDPQVDLASHTYTPYRDPVTFIQPRITEYDSAEWRTNIRMEAWRYQRQGFITEFYVDFSGFDFPEMFRGDEFAEAWLILLDGHVEVDTSGTPADHAGGPVRRREPYRLPVDRWHRVRVREVGKGHALWCYALLPKT